MTTAGMASNTTSTITDHHTNITSHPTLLLHPTLRLLLPTLRLLHPTLRQLHPTHLHLPPIPLPPPPTPPPHPPIPLLLPPPPTPPHRPTSPNPMPQGPRTASARWNCMCRLTPTPPYTPHPYPPAPTPLNTAQAPTAPPRPPTHLPTPIPPPTYHRRKVVQRSPPIHLQFPTLTNPLNLHIHLLTQRTILYKSVLHVCIFYVHILNGNKFLNTVKYEISYSNWLSQTPVLEAQASLKISHVCRILCTCIYVLQSK